VKNLLIITEDEEGEEKIGKTKMLRSPAPVKVLD